MPERSEKKCKDRTRIKHSELVVIKYGDKNIPFGDMIKITNLPFLSGLHNTILLLLSIIIKLIPIGKV